MKNSQLQDRNILPDRYAILEEKFINECISCGVCIDACPCIPMGELGNTPAEDITEEIKIFLEGGVLSGTVINRAFDCCRCGICLDICPNDIDVYGLQQALRCHTVAQGERKLTLHGIKIGDRVWDDFDFDNILASIQIKPRERRWVDGIPDKIHQKDIVVYLGCSTVRYVSKINVMLDILEMLGIDFIAIAGVCCGTRAQIVGKLKEADLQGLQLISVLKNYKPKQVLVYCPTCLYTIKKELTNIIDLPFQVNSVFNAIADNLDKLCFTHSINKTVAFHDPCKLGRMYGEYEAPRKILKAIPGVKLIEMSNSKEHSNCCGGTAWRYNPDYARHLRKIAMDDAKESGIDMLATACLICYNRFCDGAQQYPYQVIDLMEMVGEALGTKYENKLKKYINYHDPERVIIETKEYIDASPYSVEQLHRILPHLLP